MAQAGALASRDGLPTKLRIGFLASWLDDPRRSQTVAVERKVRAKNHAKSSIQIPFGSWM